MLGSKSAKVFMLDFLINTTKAFSKLTPLSLNFNVQLFPVILSCQQDYLICSLVICSKKPCQTQASQGQITVNYICKSYLCIN